MTTFTSNYDPLRFEAIFQSFNQKQSDANLHKINFDPSNGDNLVYSCGADCMRFHLILKNKTLVTDDAVNDSISMGFFRQVELSPTVYLVSTFYICLLGYLNT